MKNPSSLRICIYIVIIISITTINLFAQQPLFLLPYSSNSSFPHKCVQGNRGQPTHNSDTTRFDLDLDTPNRGQQGDPENVLAAASGTAYGFHTCDANNNCTSGFGNYIKIDHGSGIFSFYAHLSEIVVAKGMHVNQGDIIGKEGSTGLSFGDHIHFGVHTGNATLPNVGRSILIEQLEVIDRTTNSGVQIIRGDELVCGLRSEGDPVEGHVYDSTNPPESTFSSIDSVDPPPGSILADTETFTWNAVTNATEYWVYLGTSTGSRNLFDSGSLGSTTSVTISGMPQDGRDLYLRIWYRVSGQWMFDDFDYTADNVTPTAPEMINPPPGATLTSSTVTFEWTSGTGIQEYWLYVGLTPSGRELYNQSQGLNLSVTVAGLPTNGRTLYVRLWFRTGSRTWNFNDYTYTAFDDGLPDSITSVEPPPGSILADTETFTWNAVTNATEYWVYLGTSIGSRNVFNSGSIGDNTSVTATNIPQNGSTIWLRIWYRVTENWKSNDFSYTTNAPEMINPPPGSTLLSSTVEFEWVGGAGIAEYWLYVGVTPGGRDLYTRSQGLNLSATVTGLPTDGRTLYVRLWFRTDSRTWNYNDYAYTATGGG